MAKYFHGAADVVPREWWQRLLAQPPPVLACDVETVSLQHRRIIGIGVAVSPGDAVYVTVDDPDFSTILALLKQSHITKVWHNAPFDLRVLRPTDPDTANVEDTALMCRLACVPAVLEEASEGRTESAGALMKRHKAKGMDGVPEAEVAKKCCKDARATMWLYEKHGHMRYSPQYQLDRRMIPRLEEVSRKGIRLDQQVMEELYAYYRRETSYLRILADGYGFNPGSAPQVGHILTLRGTFLPFTKKWKLATDEKVLRRCQDPLAALVLSYRAAQKMLGTYVEPLRGKERAYTALHLDAVTGRINGTGAGKDEPDRNLLNIPKRVEAKRPPDMRIRRAFLPDAEVWTKADASQIELRILAHLSRDRRMMEVFKAGGNIHRDTAGGTNLTYDLSKVFNYAMIYGGDDEVLMDNTESSDIEIVRAYRQQWIAWYPGAWAWIERQRVEGLREGYVYTLGGRRMKLPLEMGEKHAMNCAVNLPIQGTAAEVFKRMDEVVEQTGADLRLYLHDEFLINGRVGLPLEDLARATEVYTPLEVTYGERWS